MKKTLRYSVIIITILATAIAYGALQRQVKVNTKDIEVIKPKLIEIMGDVKWIRGYLEKE